MPVKKQVISIVCSKRAGQTPKNRVHSYEKVVSVKKTPFLFCLSRKCTSYTYSKENKA